MIITCKRFQLLVLSIKYVMKMSSIVFKQRMETLRYIPALAASIYLLDGLYLKNLTVI